MRWLLPTSRPKESCRGPRVAMHGRSIAYLTAPSVILCHKMSDCGAEWHSAGDWQSPLACQSFQVSAARDRPFHMFLTCIRGVRKLLLGERMNGEVHVWSIRLPDDGEVPA